MTTYEATFFVRVIVKASGFVQPPIEIKIEDDRIFKAVPPDRINKYLENLGWKKTGTRKDGLVSFWDTGIADDNGDNITTDVPVDDTLDDYAYCVKHLCSLISSLYSTRIANDETYILLAIFETDV